MSHTSATAGLRVEGEAPRAPSPPSTKDEDPSEERPHGSNEGGETISHTSATDGPRVEEKAPRAPLPPATKEKDSSGKRLNGPNKGGDKDEEEEEEEEEHTPSLESRQVEIDCVRATMADLEAANKKEKAAVVALAECTIVTQRCIAAHAMAKARLASTNSTLRVAALERRADIVRQLESADAAIADLDPDPATPSVVASVPLEPPLLAEPARPSTPPVAPTLDNVALAPTPEVSATPSTAPPTDPVAPDTNNPVVSATRPAVDTTFHAPPPVVFATPSTSLPTNLVSPAITAPVVLTTPSVAPTVSLVVSETPSVVLTAFSPPPTPTSTVFAFEGGQPGTKASSRRARPPGFRGHITRRKGASTAFPRPL